MKLENMPVAKNAKLVETPEPSNMFTIKDSPELGQVPYDGERPIDFSSIPKVIARDPNRPTTVRADGSVPQSVMFDVYRAIGGASQKSKVVINALERPEQNKLMEAFRKILGDVDEVDLTPMIDVTFLLLIYFMVTTMLVQPESQLSFQLPGKPQSNNSITPMESAKINSLSDGTITLNGSPIPVDDPLELTQLITNLSNTKKLRDTLIQTGQKTKEEAELKVEIETDGLSDHQTFVSILNACSAANIDKVSLMIP